MRHVVPAALLVVALIHLLPVAGVLGGARLESLYGVRITDANLEILLRHRAVLFGLLAGFLAYAAFDPSMHRAALLAAAVSVGSFLLIAWRVGGYGAAVGTVVKVDLVAIGILAVAALVNLLGLERR